MGERTCSIDGCERPFYCLTYCRAHYIRLKRHGSPLLGAMTPREPGDTTPCMVGGCARFAGLRDGLRLCPSHWFERAAPKCSVEACGRKVASLRQTLCELHLKRERRGKRLTSIRHRAADGNALARDSQGRKECCDCKQWKPERSFGKVTRLADALNCYCKDCARRQRFVTRWGITLEQRQAMVDAQDGCCKICRVPESRLPKLLFLDHDHSHCGDRYGCSECIRGLICTRCNAALGLMDDSPERFYAAAEYIRNSRAWPSVAQIA